MLNLLTGIVHAETGTITFAGARHHAGWAPTSARQAGIGRTYQIPRPFEGMTVFENVLVGGTYGRGASEKASYEICARALHRASPAAAGQRAGRDR